jgi:hypothetical protein
VDRGWRILSRGRRLWAARHARQETGLESAMIAGAGPCLASRRSLVGAAGVAGRGVGGRDTWLAVLRHGRPLSHRSIQGTLSRWRWEKPAVAIRSIKRGSIRPVLVVTAENLNLHLCPPFRRPATRHSGHRAQQHGARLSQPTRR